ncbi:MAG: SDR family NAD(P)-dependent oxidoreductase [Proteobacteria bacterium]|nr:SDR family NAD(P)-dependent oxidoreductase [Pseudomonadota bacterium]
MVLTVAARRGVIVTGAFGALGVAVVRRFAADGARVGLIDRIAVPEALRRDYGGSHQLRGDVDLSHEAAATAAIGALADALGGLDVLVNVAGGFQWQKLEEGTAAVWESMFTMNLKTAVVACRAALPLMLARGGGRIINIGAGAAARAAAGMGAYAASKAGIERLTESLAEELKDRGILVNSILPGTLDTPRNRADMPDADFGRWVAPDAVADVAAFLAGEQARAVTGAAIRVFGRG